MHLHSFINFHALIDNVKRTCLGLKEFTNVKFNIEDNTQITERNVTRDIATCPLYLIFLFSMFRVV
jgi:hypothetical protein